MRARVRGRFPSLSFAHAKTARPGGDRRLSGHYYILCLYRIILPYSRVVAPLCTARPSTPVVRGVCVSGQHPFVVLPSGPPSHPPTPPHASRRELRLKGVVAGHGPGASSLRNPPPPLPLRPLWLWTDIFYINVLFATFRRITCTLHSTQLLLNRYLNWFYFPANFAAEHS